MVEKERKDEHAHSDWDFLLQTLFRNLLQDFAATYDTRIKSPCNKVTLKVLYVTSLTNSGSVMLSFVLGCLKDKTAGLVPGFVLEGKAVSYTHLTLPTKRIV